MIEALPPGLILILGGLLIPFVRRYLRDGLVLGLPILALAAVWLMPDGPALTIPFLSYELVPVMGSVLGRLFATVFAITAFAGGLYALRQATTLELVASLVYAGSAIGVTFAGDLLTMFVFWEIMAVGSVLVILAAGTRGARNAGYRYILVHLLGGVILMAGIAGEIAATGSVAFQAFGPLDSLPRWLILIGFLINTAAFPMAAWLSDAYPEASPSGAVVLSAFTTKTAVYVLMVGFPGADILIVVGLVMIFYGVFYGLIENDMRRLLAYSIVNQVGFMVTGIGIGTELALNGAAAHAFAHIIYKALLLMSTGAVLHQTGRRKCTDLGGLFRTMPITTVCCIIGGLAISSFPLTSGFVSKSLVSAAAADEAMLFVYFLLAAGTVGVFLDVGVKLPWLVFFGKDSGQRPKDPPRNMRYAMYLFAFLSLFFGFYPAPLYALLPYEVAYEPYTASHVLFYLQLLLFAGIMFFILLPWMKSKLTITLDTDWFYRRLFTGLGRWSWWVLESFYRGIENGIVYVNQRCSGGLDILFRPGGILTRTWFISTTALWIAALLAGYHYLLLF